MTNKESQKALAAYDSLNNILWFHNKNLTKTQEWKLNEICDILRELSEKAYQSNKKK